MIGGDFAVERLGSDARRWVVAFEEAHEALAEDLEDDSSVRRLPINAMTSPARRSAIQAISVAVMCQPFTHTTCLRVCTTSTRSV